MEVSVLIDSPIERTFSASDTESDAKPAEEKRQIMMVWNLRPMAYPPHDRLIRNNCPQRMGAFHRERIRRRLHLSLLFPVHRSYSLPNMTLLSFNTF